MESVIEKIRQARDDDRRKNNENPIETVVDGCQVKIRFDAIGDNKIITAIHSILISAHLDAAFAAPSGGESV